MTATERVVDEIEVIGAVGAAVAVVVGVMVVTADNDGGDGQETDRDRAGSAARNTRKHGLQLLTNW